MHYYTKLAKKLMEEDRYTCVICGEGITYFSEESGVRPLMQWTAEKTNVKGCCAADKIVGKAAALLYVGLGVREVYASVMSRRGEETLKKHGIEAFYGGAVRGHPQPHGYGHLSHGKSGAGGGNTCGSGGSH